MTMVQLLSGWRFEEAGYTASICQEFEHRFFHGLPNVAPESRTHLQQTNASNGDNGHHEDAEIGRGQPEELQKLAEEVTIAKAQEREAQRVKERDQRKRMQERDSDKFNVKYWLDILMGS